jgi:MGT family glycosyltransferase
MRTKIEPAGAHFVPCDAYDPQMHLSKEDGARLGKDLAFSTELIVSLTLALDDAIVQQMQTLRPDVIVSDSMAFWGKLIAKKLGVPYVCSTTTFAFNQYSAKVMQQSAPNLLGMLLSMPKINRQLKRLRAKGYAVKSVLEIIANDNDTKTIVYTSPMFQPCADTFSANYAFVGPVLRQAGEPPAAQEQPLVYISLGTVDNDHADFYRTCLRAAAQQPYRVLFSVGEETDIDALGEIPENCTVEHSVDQIAVLQSAAAFVTHCGMNSVSEALYFGVPLVMLPQTPEQTGVANRVKELQAGILLENTSEMGIRTAIDTALHQSSLREHAAQIEASFRACGGAVQAADFIEAQIK